MRPRNLFLLKTLGFSLVLFICWSPLSKMYGTILDGILQAFHPGHRTLVEKWPYTASLFLIPLFSLVLATPRIKKTRRAAIIGVGIIISLFMDFVKIRFSFGDNGQLLIAYSVYHSMKWMLPLLIWIVACHDRLGDIFSPEREGEQKECYVCPLCEEEHANIIKHIDEMHGSKSFKIKKVKRFIAQRPELSV